MSTWVDRFLGSDPGLNRLRMALQSVVTIGIILAAEWAFVHFTHALQIQVPAGAALPPAKAAVVAAANHEFLVIGIMLGAIVGMMASFGVADTTARGQLVSLLILPLPMIPALAVGLALGPYRVPALASFAVLLAVGTYFRRFGPRGFAAGMLLFMGDFMGFFLHTAIGLGDLGWLIAEIGVGVGVAIAVRFIFFYPKQAKALQRTQRSYAARARKAAALALELFDDPDHEEREIRRLQRHLTRLNEAALMIDAQLGDPGAVADGSSAQQLHQLLFDAELALTNMARFAQAATRLDIPAAQRAEIRLALIGVVGQDASGAREHAHALLGLIRAAEPVRGSAGSAREEGRTTVVILRRFASSVIALCDGMTAWLSAGTACEGQDVFQPAVVLMGGWLPGSAMVSAAASAAPGARRTGHIGLPPHIRTAIQMGIAVGAATALGDVLSGRRFYWAVIAAFITFMGANSSAEQVRKALYRIIGTAVGIVLGSLLVHAVGRDTGWSIAVILVALFFAFYLFRVNYAFMVIGITVMVSQLYVQLDEFSNSMLVLRLEETAIGSAVAAAVVLLVLPLRTRRVLRVAFAEHVQAIRQMVDHATDRLLGRDATGAGTVTGAAGSVLRADARAVDATYQALTATARPLLRNLFGGLDEETSGALRFATASRHYCRTLVTDVETTGPLDAGARLDIKQAAATLGESLDAIESALSGSPGLTYTRSSALFDQAERRLERHGDTAGGPAGGTAGGTAGAAQLAIRDLKLLDGAMAGLARATGLTLTNYDTDPALHGSMSPGGAGIEGARSDGAAGVPVHGRIIGPEGDGVARAALTLIDGKGRQVARGAADGHGAYRIYAPSAGTYTLIVSAESHPPAASAVTVRQPGAGGGAGVLLDVLLVQNGSLTGTVTVADSCGPDGVPVEGAALTLLDARGVVAGIRQSGADGGYAFSGIRSGEYTLTVTADEYQPSARTVTVPDGTAARAEIELTGLTHPAR